MKIFSIFSIIFGFTGTLILACWYPSLIANNNFLQSFITHEVINFLGVIVAITFASVENIHLYLSKIEAEFEKKEPFKAVRKEINENMYLMVGGLIVSIGLLVWKGFFPDSESISTAVYGLHLVIIGAYVFALIDIFGLISDMSPFLAQKKSNDHP